jgi:hypothetical protein
MKKKKLPVVKEHQLASYLAYNVMQYEGDEKGIPTKNGGVFWSYLPEWNLLVKGNKKDKAYSNLCNKFLKRIEETHRIVK